jgi:hypothetical protein
MKKYSIAYAVLVMLGTVLTGCSDNTKQVLGLKKTSPDEFRVIAAPPLSMPPDFNLRPPRPGAKTPETTDNQAQGALLGQEGVAAPTPAVTENPLSSVGESHLLNSVGGASEPAIREELDTQQPEKASAGLWSTLTGTDDTQPVVDAAKEKERLSDNKQQGKATTEGETPTVTSKKSVLEKIFTKE